ncbi:MAG: hypothetical protein M3N98_08680 [Actinomycetota bacterium]|nr:hypothetical protein [Actinomycetota bacterium]
MVAGFAGSVGGMTSAAFADSSGQSTTANVGVSSGITMTALTSSFLLNGAPGAVVTLPNAVSYNVETNNVAGYAVTVQSVGPTMVGTGSNVDAIPIAALTARDGGTSIGYAGLSNSAGTNVHNQSVRSANGGDILHTDYQIRIPVVNADTYTATLNYVATTK